MNTNILCSNRTEYGILSLKEDRGKGTAMYTTIATRNMLKQLDIPDSLEGQRFRVSITPINEEDEKTAFRNLKGILGKPVNLDEIREERLRAYID